MRNFFTQKVVALVLIFTFMVPASFFIVPQKAHAIIGIGDTVTVTSDFSWTSIKRTIESTLNFAKNKLTALNSITTSASSYALMLNKYVLEPALFIETGNLLKSLTAGVIKFITGGNKKGLVMFVTNIHNFKRGTADTQRVRFLDSFASRSNSPFAYSIASSLYKNQMQNSTLDGFFAANTCTLDKATTNAFVGGNFGKGGWNAWFSLTTTCQNDPYCLAYRAQSQMAGMVSDATENALNKLAWGNGFLSWCGASTNSVKGALTQTTQTSIGGSYKYSGKIGNSAGDPCTKADGTTGTIQTPGSVIKDQLQKITGVNIDKWALAGEFNGVLSNVSTILKTVQLSKMVLDGANGSGGLLSLGQSSAGAGASWADQYKNEPGFLGATTNSVLKASKPYTGSTLSTFKSNISDYSSYWNIIFGATNAASSTLNKLVSTNYAVSTSTQSTSSLYGLYVNRVQLAKECNAYKASAQNVLATVIAPILAKKATVATTVKDAQALVKKVTAESNSKSRQGASDFATDSLALQTTPPTSSETIQVQEEAMVINSATASPSGSLNVSAQTTLDKLNLITQNANAIMNKCAPVIEVASSTNSTSSTQSP
ncbi:MAG TPA: hypothetical protein ENJ75_01635 [Candidatus Kaiserbacteria bacterium]|nr:hypothetical protein [Candidatus Kaiserbacteria bacterium]